MIPQGPRTLTAWGRSSVSSSSLYAPSSIEELQSALHTEALRGSTVHRGVITRGYGRSYGDQCLNDAGTVIDTTALTAIRTFDSTTGVIECEAGVSFAQLMEFCVPLGWMPAVCPGTSIVSLGGAIANDVHGKNQHHAGNFSDHVTWFDLLLPTGTVERVSRETHAELFRATVAGIGLTGIILALQVQLQRVQSNGFRLKETRIPHLDAYLDRLPEASERNEYAVGWIDAMTSGRHLGRGVMETAEHADASVQARRKRELNIPFDCPSWMLNRASVGAFNALYFNRVPAAGRSRTVHAAQFLYALDAVHNWNRMYGTRGVYQFQCAIPFSASRSALTRILKATVDSHSASFLAVIKCMGRKGSGLLSFTRPGFSLALDFPRRPSTFALVQRLHDIVLDHDGAIYLAKDACLTASQFQAMYPMATEFRAIIDRIDPRHTMQSDMARRLGLR